MAAKDNARVETQRGVGSSTRSPSPPEKNTIIIERCGTKRNLLGAGAFFLRGLDFHWGPFDETPRAAAGVRRHGHIPPTLDSLTRYAL